MSYYTKYLKYKTKYKNLQKQLGNGYEVGDLDFDLGWEDSDDDPDTNINKNFYIYTTGLAEWGTLKTANSWLNFIRASLLRSIPPSFNNIIICHYDPLDPLQVAKTKTQINQIFNQTIIANDNALSNGSRTINSSFFPTNLNIVQVQQTNPHIVLDMAHIFEYTGVKQLSLMGHPYTNINSVYLGYCGSFPNPNFTNDYQTKPTDFANEYIASTNFININDSGVVTTYIDKIYQHGLATGQLETARNNPNEIIKSIYNMIDTQAQSQWRSKFRSVGDEFDKFREQNVQEIIRRIMELVMGNTSYTMQAISDNIYTTTIYPNINSMR